jgi:hypothetical protein
LIVDIEPSFAGPGGAGNRSAAGASGHFHSFSYHF